MTTVHPRKLTDLTSRERERELNVIMDGVSPEGSQPQEVANNSSETLTPEQQEKLRQIQELNGALESEIQIPVLSLIVGGVQSYEAWQTRVNNLATQYEGLTGVTLEEKYNQVRARKAVDDWSHQEEWIKHFSQSGSTEASARGFTEANRNKGMWQQELARLDGQEKAKIDQAVKAPAPTPITPQTNL